MKYNRFPIRDKAELLEILANYLNNIEKGECSLLWNRGEPEEMEGKLQVLGHNSHWGLRWFGPAGKNWAVCIDDSRQKKLTGAQYPSLKIYQEPYKK